MESQFASATCPKIPFLLDGVTEMSNDRLIHGTIHQRNPEGLGEVVLTHVLRDLVERAEYGHRHYGTYLRTHNGRDALLDAYQEALDLCMYLKQALIERDGIGT